jgi:hypothetical protein
VQKRQARVTTQPESPAPQLFCPRCSKPLVYRQTVLNGVAAIERWDYFACRTHGVFEYRERTRQLRQTAELPLHVPPVESPSGT